MKKVHRVKKNPATYEIDIGQEFHEVKAAIKDGQEKFTNEIAEINKKLDSFKEEISGWKTVFDTQLTKLNFNMDKALSTIADHEARLTEIEKKSLEAETKVKTVGEMGKLTFFAAKALIGAGIFIGAVLGTAGAWKLIFPAA